jgi:hypothetical protein
MLIELGKLGQHARRGGGMNTGQMMPRPVTSAQAVAVVRVGMGVAISLSLVATARGIADYSVTPFVGADQHFRTLPATAAGVPNVTVQQAGNHGGLLLALMW